MLKTCGVQLKDRKRIKDLMPILGLNEANDMLDMENSVKCHGMC